VMKSLFDYAMLLFFARLHVWTIVRNMLAHLAFLVVALVLADSITVLPTLIAVALVMAAANLGMSLHGSSELRGVVYKLWTRLTLSVS
jgi:hypothetical protein